MGSVNEPLNNSHRFDFQNLICLWLSTPKLRFCYIGIIFSFAINQGVNRTLQFRKLRRRGKNRVSILERITEIFLHGIVIYFSIKLHLFCSWFEKKTDPNFFSWGRGLFWGDDQWKTHE